MAEIVKRKMGDMPWATYLSGEESIPMLQNGSNPRATLSMLKEYFHDSSLVIFDKVDDNASPNVSSNILTREEGATFSIVYLISRKAFMECKLYQGVKYYSTTFTSSEDYMHEGTPRTDRVFFCVEDKGIYIYNGELKSVLESVRIHAMTEDELANLENPIEGAFYATYEE